VELVEDDEPRARERGVVLDHADEHSLGHRQNARGGGAFRLGADAVPDEAAQRRARELGDALGGRHRGHAARLEHQDHARHLAEEARRHEARLAGPRLGGEHQGAALAQARGYLGEKGLDGQAGASKFDHGTSV
jgi:hypothetical protein